MNKNWAQPTTDLVNYDQVIVREAAYRDGIMEPTFFKVGLPKTPSMPLATVRLRLTRGYCPLEGSLLYKNIYIYIYIIWFDIYIYIYNESHVFESMMII